MSDAHGITKENLLLACPSALRKSASIAALGDATADVLSKRPSEIRQISLYTRIDELPEDLLDILAPDFKVDWWDPNYSLEEKRRVFKASWYVHKHLGTKAAVETAIRDIYPLTTVEEWFEYEGGKPYHFRLRINITSDSGDPARRKRVLERLNFYKNLRSHVDEIRYFLMPSKSWAAAGGLMAGSREVDRASIRIPPLKRPGGETTLITGGGLAGARRQINAAVSVPPLTRPRGAAERAAAAGFLGSVERVKVKLDAGRVKVPAGRAATGGTAGVFHSYQRIRVSVRNPVITERSL